MRKDETSWASEGSKGVLWRPVPLEEREESDVFDEDLRPVNLSQIDILKERRRRAELASRVPEANGEMRLMMFKQLLKSLRSDVARARGYSRDA